MIEGNNIQLDDLGRHWGIILNQIIVRLAILERQNSELIQKIKELEIENKRLRQLELK